MGNEVFGPYESRDEVINMVTALQLKGYKSSNISLFAHEDYAEDLIKHTDVNVESETDSKQNQPKFVEKIQRLFSNDKNSHATLYEKLTNENISGKQADKLMEAIENGEIVVIADNELKMGNDSTSNAVSMRENMIQRE
ncbi:general stress protein [Virgibacillus sp. YIM 98842]|uniref:general stress protein n=1 Tax=Virgibacillus sp. YIM 98842 TaxID=2663533 RepID=UPI0013DAF72F|nr:general stress protein [Virgibacillus sp. YIM 98842]